MTERLSTVKCFEQYKEEIEDGGVYVDAVLANTPKDLLRRLEQNEVVQDIKLRMVEPNMTRLLFNRAVELVDEPLATVGFANDNDLSLAAYLFVLEAVQVLSITVQVRDFVQMVATSGRDDLRSARYVAKEVLKCLEERTGTANNHFSREVSSSHQAVFDEWEEIFSQTENVEATQEESPLFLSVQSRYKDNPKACRKLQSLLPVKRQLWTALQTSFHYIQLWIKFSLCGLEQMKM